ncbi:hypothetical protein B0G76_4585 [Paraburkholderia sp. BL23I1N1]|nr:hypothetical protein B0G76_4585 [Paraburkholderia sp. BL23I1N1]
MVRRSGNLKTMHEGELEGDRINRNRCRSTLSIVTKPRITALGDHSLPKGELYVSGRSALESCRQLGETVNGQSGSGCVSPLFKCIAGKRPVEFRFPEATSRQCVSRPDSCHRPGRTERPEADAHPVE